MPQALDVLLLAMVLIKELFEIFKIMKARKILQLFLLIPILYGCTHDESDDNVSYSGRILIGKEPLKENGISIVGNSGASHETTTDAEGKFQFTGLPKGSYSLRISNLKTDGQFYEMGVPLNNSVTDAEIVLPGPVTLYEATGVTDESVVLKWSKSTATNFREYKVYRHSGPGLDETTGTLVYVATSASDTTFTDTDLLGNTTYYYRTFVRDNFGLYGGSNIIHLKTEPQNFVVNGSFEEGLSGWTLYNPNNVIVSVVEGEGAPSGTHCLKVEITENPDLTSDLIQYISQNKFVAGKTYTLSFSAKVAEMTGEAKLYLACFKSWTFYDANIVLNANSSNEWTRYTVDFIAPSSDQPFTVMLDGQANFFPTIGDPYKLFIDDIVITSK